MKAQPESRNEDQVLELNSGVNPPHIMVVVYAIGMLTRSPKATFQASMAI